MTEPVHPRPPFEPHTALMLAAFVRDGLYVPLDPATIAATRKPVEESRDHVLRTTGLEHRDLTIPGPDGDLTVAVLRRPGDTEPGPLFLWFHGGGLIQGNRFSSVDQLAPMIERHGGVIVSPEYRLAPEHPAPAGMEDCYATFLWAVAHAEELGGDPSRVLVTGASAGGNLALAVALAARDRRGPGILGVLAPYPMLDDRNDSVAVRQFWDEGTWTGHDNEVAWDATLGERRGTDDVSYLEAPARAEWLGDLPPIFLDVASTEPFRDEVVDFASRVWRDGGDAELHVYPGGTHVHEVLSAKSWIGEGVFRARGEWVARLLDPVDPSVTYDHVVASGKYPLLGSGPLETQGVAR
ncbi:alpha/beta hydrolase [Tessaracoccus oleiagri]|uniref:Acetyl esterase/lipase n=1 Tax=Tessaracoccus oleiagri TaxID=686624 RepID=A0A1G9HX21_9ACTN|nr:alpha/beta hydrolase fold domain-containing protein [Tessaracoccus oleiagri]SDL17557.1 Acetyl esterase/lipase [Tessaracoccus oleiagri]